MKEYLTALLLKDDWTRAEKEWLLQYLNGGDTSVLQEIAESLFHTDLENLQETLDRRLSEDMLDKIHARLQQASVHVLHAKKRWFRMAAAAAALVLITGAAVLYSGRILNLFGTPMLAVNTAAGERKTIHLPDGSTVVMEPKTVLKYPRQFSGKQREVDLTGEAFFDVTRNEQQAFVIHSPLLNTTVMGTSFNVQDHSGDSANVVVVTGSVKVAASGSDNSVLVKPNQGVAYNVKQNVLELKPAGEDAAYYAQRSQGHFVYKGVPVLTVVNDLERYYHIDITMSKSMQHCSFYGDFHASDTLQKALSVIAITLNATITQTDKGYALSGEGCK